MRKVMVTILIAVFLIIFIAGCTVNKPNQIISSNQRTSLNTNNSSQTQEEQITKPQTCEEKASSLIPPIFRLTISSSYDPNSDGWSFVSPDKWLDNTTILFKGDIEFQKGRNNGENTDYWYTRNIQNEQLFGVGGLKYEKQVTTKSGVTGKNFFIIKPVLKSLQIIHTNEPFSPYNGTFTVIDNGFVNCSWAE